LPALREEVLPARRGDSLEMDELWTFVQRKKNAHWLWLCVSFRTRQVVSFALGRRDFLTAQKAWSSLPRSYWKKTVYTDKYVVYPALIGDWQHRPSEKYTGRTSAVERVNLTFRQRVSALVRKTLSFAKSSKHLWLRLRWFVHCYNRERQQRLQRKRSIA